MITLITITQASNTFIREKSDINNQVPNDDFLENMYNLQKYNSSCFENQFFLSCTDIGVVFYYLILN